MSSEDNFGAGGAAEQPQAYVIEVRGQPMAIGLFWSDFDSRSSAASEALAAAANPNYGGDLYCIRALGNQYGIASRENGHAKNMVPLAAALADKNPGTWVGVFAVGDGYYVLGVRDDKILTDTDRYLTDELDVRIMLEEVMSGGSGWAHVYAPESFDIQGSAPTELEELLGKARAPRLVPTDKVSGFFKLVVAGVLITALVGGGMYYMNYQAEQEFLRAQEEAARAYEEQLASQPAVTVPMPWEGRAMVGGYLDACMAAISKAVLDVPGWKVVGLACDTSSVRMTLDRDGELGEGGGTINWVRWALDRSGLQNAQASPTGANSVEVVWGMDDAEKHPEELTGGTPSLGMARRYLQSLFEETFTTINFESPVDSEYWATLNFNFDTPFDPREFESILNKVPGLTIESVILDVTTLGYKVRGSVYEKLEIVNAQLN